MSDVLTVQGIGVRCVADPRVTVSFTAAVTAPRASIGYPLAPDLTTLPRMTVAHIQKVVAAYYNMTPVELISDRRSRVVARPRQVAMWLAKRLTTRSLPDIGRRFGGRDHSTVLHAVRRIDSLLVADASLRLDCDRLMAGLGCAP